MTLVWRAVAITAVILAAYSNCFQGPFVIDDQASVVQNTDIRDLSRLDRVLSPSPDSPVAGRPLVSLTFAIDYALNGLQTTGYHATNLAWHLACAWLFFGVARRTLALSSMPDAVRADADDLALAATLVWGVHPLTTEVVDYLSQRSESMMAFFLLLTLYAAIRAAFSPARGWQALAIVACLVGTVCKETIVVAPLLVVLYDRVFLYRSWSASAAARGRLYVGLGAAWLVLGGLVLSGPRAAVAGAGSGVSTWTYLLNQAGIVVDYLRLTVWPSGLVALYGWPDALTLRDVLPEALIVLALLALTLAALIRVPRLGYLGAWIFVTLAPTSSVIPIATEVGAERRMYLPLMALSLLAVLGGAAAVRAGLGTASQRLPMVRRVSAALLMVVVAGLGVLTYMRARDYTSAVTLARTVVERRPTAVAHHLLGEQLGIAGQTAEAEKELRAAVALGNTRARYPLGLLLMEGRRSAEAGAEFETFVATAGVPQRMRWLEPPLIDVLTARLYLAQIYADGRRWADAAAQARVVLEASPRHPEATRLLGLALVGAQVFPDAIATLRDYLAIRPRDTAARSNLAVALVGMGRMDEAVQELQRAVQTDPNDANARRLLGLALADQGHQSRPPGAGSREP